MGHYGAFLECSYQCAVAVVGCAESDDDPSAGGNEAPHHHLTQSDAPLTGSLAAGIKHSQ